MNLLRYKRANDYEVRNWLINNIPELTKYQEEKIRDEEIIRFSPFYFYKEPKKVNNPLIRLTIIFYPIVWLLLFIGLPINFIFTGKWGYGGIKWFMRWTNACGL